MASNNTFNPISDALNIKQRPENHVNYTEFNRSYPHITTGKMGQIIPFFFDEVMAGDFWKVSGEYLFRFAPMYLPIFTQVKVYIDYYYIPFTLLWGIPKQFTGYNEDTELLRGWQDFISSFDENQSFPKIDIPMSAYHGSQHGDEAISDFGLPTNPTDIVTPGVLRVTPLPFIALLQIYDQYYRNDQVQDQRGMIYLGAQPDYSEICLAFRQYGQIDWTNPAPGTIRRLRRNWDNDYYTVMTPTPQLGANVLIPMINDLSEFWADEVGAPTLDGKSYPSLWRTLIADNPATDTFGAGGINIAPINSLTQNPISGGQEYIGLDIQSTAASIQQLRKNLQLTEILERAMRAGDKYKDFMFKFFEEDIDPLNLDIPQWFGGHTGKVVVSDVFATANTTLTPTPQSATTVGSYAGNAIAVDKVRQHKVKCREHGYVMGLLSVVPESSYQNGLHPLWTRDKWYDFPFEQFALVGDRPMLRSEMQLILSSTVDPSIINNYIENNEVLGYVPMYHEMRYRTAIVAGQMRTLWESYHLGRIFGQSEGDGILLGDELLVCLPRITDVFQVTYIEDSQEDEIHILVYNHAYVDRRLPKYAVPQTGI